MGGSSGGNANPLIGAGLGAGLGSALGGPLGTVLGGVGGHAYGGKNDLGMFGKILDPLNIFGLNSPKMPKLETPVTSTESQARTPTEADPSVALAAAEERRRRQAAKGGGSTILTGGLGASGAADTQKKTLLG